MDVSMEILLKRQRVADLESQQLTLAIEQARLREEIRVLLAGRDTDSSNALPPVRPSGNVIGNSESTPALSKGHPSAITQAQENVRPPSSEFSDVQGMQSILAAPHSTNVPSFSIAIANANGSQLSLVESIEASPRGEEYIRPNEFSDDAEVRASECRQDQLKKSQSPPSQSSQQTVEGKISEIHRNSTGQDRSVTARESVPSTSLFFQATPTPPAQHLQPRISYADVHNILPSPSTTFTSLFMPYQNLQANYEPSRSNVVSPAPPRASSPRTANFQLYATHVDPPQHVASWQNTRHSVTSEMAEDLARQPMVFPQNYATHPFVPSQLIQHASGPNASEAEVEQYSFIGANGAQANLTPQPNHHGYNLVDAPYTTSSTGLGICALKKRNLAPAQEHHSNPQNVEEYQRMASSNMPNLIYLEGSNPGKRSASTTITGTRPSKRRAEEHARVTTPPLNESTQRIVRDTVPRPMITTSQNHQLIARSATRNRSMSQRSESSAEPDETEEDSDSYDTASGSNSTESSEDEPDRRKITSMRDRIFPQFTTQPYTLHMQSQSRMTVVDSSTYTRRSLVPIPSQQKARVIRPTSQQQMRQRRAAGASVLATPYQNSPYRRLTSSERCDLELRYCARLSRLLCSNTCISTPPLPLCDETLWQRLVRRFRVEDGHPPPPKYDSEEVYANAADFEVDVKAMLRQYVVLGHCGEQAQVQGQSRNARVIRCEFEKTGNARVMCWRMRLESILDEKLRELKYVLRQCEESYEGDDIEGKRACIDAVFEGVTLGD